MKPRAIHFAFPLFLSLGLPLAAQSTYTAGTGNWSTAASWSPAGVPAAGANIILSDGSTGTLTLDGTASRTIGSYTHGTTGARTAEFAIKTGATNSLTFGGGLTANGNITGVGLRLRGNHIVSGAQTWQIAGSLGTPTADAGVTNQDITASTTRGTFTLNGNLTKTGSGQLMFAGTTISGAADLIVNQGALKLNAGSSLELRATGPGKFILNNDSSLFFSKNSGTFGDSDTFNRAFSFNDTASVITSGNAAGTLLISSPMAWNGSHLVTLTNSLAGTGLHYNFAGIMSGPGSLTKAGPSQLFLSGTGSNTLSGLVTVTAGELRLAKTAATAIAGNLTISGGVLRMDEANQIADTATVTVSGAGRFIDDTGKADTIAALAISSTATSSLSNITVSGATTISAGIQDVNSGYSFTTNSLAISNNAAIRFGANTTSTTVTVGTGGLTLSDGQVIFGSAGGVATAKLNLSGNLTSSGASLLTPPNYNGPRITDLQSGVRTFEVTNGTLGVFTSVNNGVLVKSGAGTLQLRGDGSTASFSFTAGPVEITGPNTATDVSLSAGTLLMDIGGAAPAKITASGDCSFTGGAINISVLGGPVAPGTLDLIRYTGTRSGTPVINLAQTFADSRMNPSIDYGGATNDAITLTTTAVPLTLTWDGSAGSTWDINGLANFDSGGEKFIQLDSVLFDDSGKSASVQLNSTVYPGAVIFDHGATVPTYTLAGSGKISGPATITKLGDGTSIIATANDNTGTVTVSQGTLRIGNGGTTGNLGSGAVTVDYGAILESSRSDTFVFVNPLSGSGSFKQSGPGTLIIPANNTSFTGDVSVSGGTLQLGDGGIDGSFGTGFIDISAAATLAIKRSGTPNVANSISGDGGVTVSGGSPILSGYNTHTGGVTVNQDGCLRLPSDASLGALPASLVTNAIRLNQGGLKNQDSDTVIDAFRGITLSGDAFFTAGWTKTLTIAGPITGSGGLFINRDSGRVILTNDASDWTGVLTLGADKPGFNGTTGGNLQISSISNGGVAGPLGKSSADPTNLIFDSGRLIYDGAEAATDRGFTLVSSGTIEVVFSSLEMNGLATGPGAFAKAGAGTLILTSANDFEGSKTITAGTVVMKDPSALGTTAAEVIFTGTTGALELATDTSAAPYSITIGVNNTATIYSGVGTAGNGINHTLGNLTLSTITLTAAASADVTGGNPALTFGNLNLSAGASGTTTLNPTTADIYLGSVSIGVNNAVKTLSLGGTSQNNRVTGVISDGIATVSLRKDNDSLWTVSGDSSFTGNVTVDDGVLAITHSNALGATNKTLVVAGNAAENRLPELRVSGGIAPAVAILTLSGNGIAATGALRNLAGDNTLTATTQVNLASGNGGTTLYSDSGTLTLNSPLISANATNRNLILAGPGNGVVNGSVQNGSTVNLPVTKNGSGTWALNGAHTYTGTTTVLEGVLALGQAALDDSSTVNIVAGAKLNLNFAGNDTVAAINLGGSPMSPGTYNVSHPVYGSYFSGSGSLVIPPSTTPFEDWIASNYPGLTGTDALPGADPDADGVSNLLEFILNGNPQIGSSMGFSFVRIENTNAIPGKELIQVLAMRKNAVFAPDGKFQAQEAVVDGVQCRVEGSADLTDFTGVIETLALPLPTSLTNGLPALDSAWEYRAFRLKNSDGLPGKGFMRLRVSE